MKKLLIALAALGLAVGAQAASISWSIKFTNNKYMFDGNTSDKFTGTLYIFDSANVDQATMLSAILGGTKTFADYTGSALSSTSVSAGALATSPWAFTTENNNGDTRSVYFAALDASDNLLLTTATTKTMSTLGGVPWTYNIQTQSQGLSTASAFSAGSWYKATATPVAPEPTSGLLMLVGLGALALRRRKA